MSTSTDPNQLKEEGLKLFKRGNYDQALTRFETAEHAYAAENNEAGQAEALNNIGVIYRLQRQPAAAIKALESAEMIFARLGEVNKQAQALGNLGDVHAANGHRDTAARCYSDATALFARIGDGERQGQVLRALSLMRLRQGRWLEAMTYMEQSLTVRPRRNPAQYLFRLLLRFALSLIS